MNQIASNIGPDGEGQDVACSGADVEEGVTVCRIMVPPGQISLVPVSDVEEASRLQYLTCRLVCKTDRNGV